MDLPRDTVDVPELGGTVVLEGLSVGDTTAVLDAVDQAGSYDARIVAATMIAPALTEADVPALEACRTDVLARLADVGRALCGLGAAVEQRLGEAWPGGLIGGFSFASRASSGSRSRTYAPG